MYPEHKKHAKTHIGCGPFCIVKFPDKSFREAYITYTKLTNWAGVYNNTDIVKKVINPDYWEAVEGFDIPEDELSLYLFLLLAAVGVLLITLIIALAIIRRRRNLKSRETKSGEYTLTGSEITDS